jgi:hypothetical protein
LWPTLLFLFAEQAEYWPQKGANVAKKNRVRVRLMSVRRRLFNVLSSLSLLLCLTICVLWVRSYQVADHFPFGGDPGFKSHEIVFSRGRMFFGHNTRALSSRIEPEHHWTEQRSWKMPMFSFWSMNYQRTFHLTFPLWIVALLLALVPASRFVMTAAGRKGTNSCSHCGYDLRATPDRCPECGTVVVARASRPC